MQTIPYVNFHFINNHFYLYCLLGPLFIATRANASFSLDRRRHPERPVHVPLWSLLLFRAQIIFVYFYGGIAKLNADWLAGEPLRRWLAFKADTPVVGPVMTAMGLSAVSEGRTVGSSMSCARNSMRSFDAA